MGPCGRGCHSEGGGRGGDGCGGAEVGFFEGQDVEGE